MMYINYIVTRAKADKFFAGYLALFVIHFCLGIWGVHHVYQWITPSGKTGMQEEIYGQLVQATQLILVYEGMFYFSEHTFNKPFMGYKINRSMVAVFGVMILAYMVMAHLRVSSGYGAIVFAATVFPPIIYWLLVQTRKVIPPPTYQRKRKYTKMTDY